MTFKPILILFCAFQIELIQNTLASKLANLNIDEFINELIVSKKFNELADIIAERAVLKIQAAEMRLTNARAKLGYDDSNKKMAKAFKKSKKSKRQFGKINTDAFLKEDLKSGELVLNYKHMTDKFKRKDHNIKKDKKTDRATEDVQENTGASLDHRQIKASEPYDNRKQPKERDLNHKDIESKRYNEKPHVKTLSEETVIKNYTKIIEDTPRGNSNISEVSSDKLNNSTVKKHIASGHDKSSKPPENYVIVPKSKERSTFNKKSEKHVSFGENTSKRPKTINVEQFVEKRHDLKSSEFAGVKKNSDEKVKKSPYSVDEKANVKTEKQNVFHKQGKHSDEKINKKIYIGTKSTNYKVFRDERKFSNVKDSKEILASATLKATGQNVDLSDDFDANVNVKQGNHTPLIRNEDGKLYTQNFSSPDYKEYYDKIMDHNSVNTYD